MSTREHDYYLLAPVEVAVGQDYESLWKDLKGKRVSADSRRWSDLQRR